MSRRTLRDFVRLCMFSDTIGYHPSTDMSTVNSIGQDVTERLREQFGNNSKGAGGGFDTKSMLLFALVRRYRPSLVIETGVAQGVTSYFMLKAIALNGKGKLISIDLPNRSPNGYVCSNGMKDTVWTPGNLEPGWLVPDNLRQYWDLRLGKSVDLLPSISDEIDVFFHDSEHSYENMIREYQWAWSHLKAKGFLVSDDIDWNASFEDFRNTHEDSEIVLEWRNIGILKKSPSSPHYGR